jgi:hypothetical protein
VAKSSSSTLIAMSIYQLHYAVNYYIVQLLYIHREFVDELGIKLAKIDQKDQLQRPIFLMFSVRHDEGLVNPKVRGPKNRN